MKKLFFIFFMLLSSLILAQDEKPVAQPIDLKEVSRGKSAKVDLVYTDAEDDKATSCRITSAQYVEVFQECTCEDGKCSVGLIFKEAGRGGITYNVTANNQTSDDVPVLVQINSEVDIWTDILGIKGILFAIALGVFAVSYMNSIKLFNWIDQQTHGTRDYILKKFEIMFIEVKPETVTYALLFLSFGMGILTFSLLALLGKLPLAILLGIVMGIVGWKAPKPVVDFFENRRKEMYSIQMVDALNLLANGLRAGLTVPQAIGMVVEELPPPVSQEFNLVLQQAKIGVPIDEALENLKKRVYTEDNEMFVTSVNILRETGGNLAEVFDTIVGVIRERVRLHLKIKTYVKSGMFQAYTIGSMPFLMILVLGAGDPEIFPMFFGTIPGIIALLAICGLVALGMWVIMKIVDIKV